MPRATYIPDIGHAIIERESHLRPKSCQCLFGAVVSICSFRSSYIQSAYIQERLTNVRAMTFWKRSLSFTHDLHQFIRVGQLK